MKLCAASVNSPCRPNRAGGGSAPRVFDGSVVPPGGWISGQWNQSRPADAAVARHQRRAMNQTGGGDDPVGWIASKIQSADSPAYRQVQRPDMDAGKRPREIRRIDVQIDPSQLRQFGQLPNHDGRDAPLIVGERLAFLDGELPFRAWIRMWVSRFSIAWDRRSPFLRLPRRSDRRTNFGKVAHPESCPRRRRSQSCQSEAAENHPRQTRR